ncbi:MULTISPECIES: choice-of-anchor P family protein [Nocardioides]|uniref:Choice-of-anchor P family protein n=1 Tax=Nocardioides vastitatis TaxID=2568655 RepID=A0ABW0ZJW7_9ACTN|nr:choice-of-anchor P family protein [Nocardioides sp.]THJ04518.1 hypothetical protein E7Z54_08500 [Nocardioides sp.]
MKINRHLAPAAGALLLVTGAASVALFGGGTAASAAGEPSSAFGIALNIADNEAIPPTPFVESTDGSLVEDSAVDVPGAPLLEAGAMNVAAQNGQAKASVAELSVVLLDSEFAQLAELGTQLEPLCAALDNIPVEDIKDEATDEDGTLAPDLFDPLVDEAAGHDIRLDLITALDFNDVLPDHLGAICDFAESGNLFGAAIVAAECNGDSGDVTVEFTNGLLPTLIDTNRANSAIEIPQLVKVTLNRQTNNADGTFTVDALNVTLFDQIDLTVASATCGEVTSDRGGDVDPSEAPAPDPVETHVPVTG